MSFKKGDWVICEIRKFNLRTPGYYDVTIKNGILLGSTCVTLRKTIMHLVKFENGDQNYIYEENIVLDIVKIRNNKLKDIGI